MEKIELDATYVNAVAIVGASPAWKALGPMMEYQRQLNELGQRLCVVRTIGERMLGLPVRGDRAPHGV